MYSPRILSVLVLGCLLAALLLWLGKGAAPVAGDPVQILPSPALVMEGGSMAASALPTSGLDAGAKAEEGSDNIPQPTDYDFKESTLLDAYSTMDRARPFALSAWQRPESGGRFYAARVVQNCLALSKQTDLQQVPQLEYSTADDSRTYLLRVRAFEMLIRQCADFSAEELTSMGFDGAESASDGREDFYLTLSRRFSESRQQGDSHSRLVVVKDIIEAADPLLLREIGPRLAVDRAPDAGPHVWFDGRMYPLSEYPDFLAAFELLPCVLGLPCNGRDFELALQCAIGGACHSTRRDLVLQQWLAGDADRLSQVERWASLMAERVRQGRADAFVRPVP